MPPEFAREPARAVLKLALSRPATLGAGRLLAIDGPSGSGKTSLAAAIAAVAPTCTVVHLDDLYAGWSGLPHLAEALAGLLLPLSEGRPGHFRRYDWHADDWAEDVFVAPTGLLVLEGVGSGSREFADLVTALVWLEVSPDVGLARALDRDGGAYEPQLRAWQHDEARHYAVDATRERADIVLG
jgi:uridine kinase